jgi:hypothetical protein
MDRTTKIILAAFTIAFLVWFWVRWEECGYGNIKIPFYHSKCGDSAVRGAPRIPDEVLKRSPAN